MSYPARAEGLGKYDKDEVRIFLVMSRYLECRFFCANLRIKGDRSILAFSKSISAKCCLVWQYGTRSMSHPVRIELSLTTTGLLHSESKLITKLKFYFELKEKISYPIFPCPLRVCFFKRFDSANQSLTGSLKYSKQILKKAITVDTSRVIA